MMMVEDLPPEKLQKMAKQLHESAQMLLDISVNLLEINKVRGNLMNIEPELFNIYLKTQDIMVSLDIPLSIKKIRLWNKINPHQMVYADPETINSVLLNLINNAIKFTPEKGEITITSALTNNSFVQINVTDSGVGFEEAEINQIFTQQKFSTRVGTSGEKGTGVGLVLSKDLVEKNGGKLLFKNNDNRPGSTFSFTLKVQCPND
jgi:signal transduction histidine kinase